MGRIEEQDCSFLSLFLFSNMVTNPNSILFVMDLHLDIPNHFLDDVRKVSQECHK